MPDAFLKSLQELPRVIIGTTIVFFFIVFAFRLVGKSDISQLSLTDFVIILVISEAANSGILGPSESILASVTAIATLLFWDFIMKKFLLRHPRTEEHLEGAPIILVRHGRIIEANLKKVDMNGKKLAEALRKEGIGKVTEVWLAVLEPSGEISVIPMKPENPD